MSPLRRSPALAAALCVFVLAGAALTITHHEPRQPIPTRVAIADALRSWKVKQALTGLRFTGASASGLDGRNERVSFFDGSRMVADVLMRSDGTVAQVGSYHSSSVPPYGDWIAYEPPMLIGLGLLFALMTGVAPLRRARNLDVLAALSFLATVVLLARHYVGASALSTVPGMLWLTFRCALRGLGRRRPAPPSVPLFDLLTRGLTPRERRRVLQLTLLVLVLIFVMVGVSSPSADDVAYAVMEGATRLIHGVLPYGHLPGDVFHGDTYPILSYALYVPVALLEPVNTIFSSVDGALAAAVLAALAAAGAAAWAARGGAARMKRRPGGRQPAELAGLRTAVALLSFPPLLITASAGTTDPALGALVIIALLLWRRPALSSGTLAIAGWFKLAPFALVPLWLAPRRGRELLCALGALLGISLASLGLIVALGGTGGLAAMVHAIGYQFDRESPQSAWYALGLLWLQPLGQAAVLALIIAATVQLWRDRALAADPERIAALAAAILLGLQFTASQWAFMYLAWALPLLGLSLFPEPAYVGAAAATPPSALAHAPIGGSFGVEPAEAQVLVEPGSAPPPVQPVWAP